jgi:predicted amidophosphoribosyltransferase
MKICPECHAEVEETFNICWNCQYSFDERRKLKIDDFRLICPECNAEIHPSVKVCPNCFHRLDDMPQHFESSQPGGRSIACFHCHDSMKYLGNVGFHPGIPDGAPNNLSSLSPCPDSLEVYWCSNCGRVEFYLPGFC